MSENEHPLAAIHPELRRFPTREAADAAMHDWEMRSYRAPGWWASLLGVALGAGLVAYVVLMFAKGWLPTGRTGHVVRLAVTGAALSTLISVSVGLIWRRRMRRFLRERLAELGVPICVRCGYDLRGQTTPRCPECGRAFVLGAREPDGGEGGGAA